MLDDFKKYLIEENGVSEKYAQITSSAVKKFASPIFKSKKSLKKIDIKFIRQYLTTPYYSKYRLRMTLPNITAIRSFLAWAYLKKLTLKNLSINLPIKKSRKINIPKKVCKKDIRKILKTCDRRTFKGARAYAVIMLLLELGLRRSEISNLTFDHINWHEGTIAVHSKGSSSVLPLPEDVGSALSSYLKKRKNYKKIRHIFLTIKAPYNPLPPIGISSILNFASRKAGLKQISSHKFRHSLAINLLDKGGTLSEIGQILRHKSIDTTRIYAQVDDLKLREIVAQWPKEVV